MNYLKQYIREQQFEFIQKYDHYGKVISKLIFESNVYDATLNDFITIGSYDRPIGFKSYYNHDLSFDKMHQHWMFNGKGSSLVQDTINNLSTYNKIKEKYKDYTDYTDIRLSSCTKADEEIYTTAAQIVENMVNSVTWIDSIDMNYLKDEKFVFTIIDKILFINEGKYKNEDSRPLILLLMLRKGGSAVSRPAVYNFNSSTDINLLYISLAFIKAFKKFYELLLSIPYDILDKKIALSYYNGYDAFVRVSKSDMDQFNIIIELLEGHIKVINDK